MEDKVKRGTRKKTKELSALSSSENKKYKKHQLFHKAEQANKSLTGRREPAALPLPLACITNTHTNDANGDQHIIGTCCKKQKGVTASTMQMPLTQYLNIQNLIRAKEDNVEWLNHIGIASTFEERLEKLN